MNWWWIILIVIGGYLLLGPIMLGFAKLNHIDPYILEKDPDGDINSFIMVQVFGPLFSPLWLETKVIRWIKKKLVH